MVVGAQSPDGASLRGKCARSLGCPTRQPWQFLFSRIPPPFPDLLREKIQI